MGFIVSSTTLGSAVASGATFTITVPTATIVGAVKANGGHVMIVRQMNALFNFPNDWVLTSWSGATATITYNGTTTIPAGSLVQIQFEVVGDDTNYPYRSLNSTQVDYTKVYRGSFGQVFRVDFGAALAASTTAILATTAVTDTLVHTLATPYVLDVPRALQYVSSSTDTSVITVRGFDEYGVALTESKTLNSGTPVLGTKAFKTVVSYQSNPAMSNNLSLGFLNVLGLPFYLPARGGTGVGSILREEQDGALATAGTAVGGVLTKASATTGDVRGTITPNTAPDGSKVYSVFMFVADTQFLGVPQYGA